MEKVKNKYFSSNIWYSLYDFLYKLQMQQGQILLMSLLQLRLCLS